MLLGKSQRKWNATQIVLYFASCLFGGIAGAISIIVAVVADAWWECKYWNRNCYDGQGGIILVVLVPVMFMTGLLAAFIWTWITSQIPSKSVFASVYNYDGARRGLNIALAAVASTGLWCAICFGLFRLIIYLNSH
jgi:hypothetical protein